MLIRSPGLNRLLRIPLFAMLSLSLLLPSLLPPGLAIAAQARQADGPATLNVAMAAPNTLDLVRLSRFDLAARDLVENLFVGLTRYDPITQQTQPMLATSWTPSEDGLTWRFELRDDIQWMRLDSASQTLVPVRPVVAGDFVYAVQRACDPRRPSPLTANVMIIRGCRTVAEAFPEVVTDLFIAREIGVRATGPYSLEIDVLYSASYFPGLLSMPELFPLPREDAPLLESDQPAAGLMTSGPFGVLNWNASGMTLGRNPAWPDEWTGNVDRVQITFDAPGSAGVSPAAMSGGQIDFARISAEAAPSWTDSALLQQVPGNTVLMLGFSQERAIVQDPAARRALAQALDVPVLAQQFFPAQTVMTGQFTPPGPVAAPPVRDSYHNSVSAAENWAVAGYPGCASVPEKMEIMVPNDAPIWEQLGQAIVAQWIDVLGCNPALFEVRPINRGALIEISHANYNPDEFTRPHIWLLTWTADYYDANAWLWEALYCDYGYLRLNRPCSPADDLLDQAGVTTDAAGRAQLYAQAEEQFFGPSGSFPVAPLFFSATSWLQQPWLSAVNRSGPARYDLWSVDTGASGRATP